jgi:signal-transduction protein with cAMP-binding, CBS, and nucleotidyltransferase domain
METGYKVADCMTIKPITVSKDTSLVDCSKMMRDKHVGSLLVVEKGKLIGLITEQDMVRKAMAELLDPEKTVIEKVMVTELITITPDKDIYDALKMMRDYNIRHLPVMDRGQMVGFLTMKDILKIQPQLFDLIVEKIELREESRKPISAEEEGVCDGCGNYAADLEEVDGSMLCSACRNLEDHSNADEQEEEDIA